MNMQNIPDKDLDQLFKDADADHNISFEESSWLKLESKLESARRKKNIRNRVALLLVLLALGFKFSGIIFDNQEGKISIRNFNDEKTASITNKINRKNNNFLEDQILANEWRERPTKNIDLSLLQAFKLKKQKPLLGIKIESEGKSHQTRNEATEQRPTLFTSKKKVIYSHTLHKNLFLTNQTKSIDSFILHQKEERGRQITLGLEGKIAAHKPEISPEKENVISPYDRVSLLATADHYGSHADENKENGNVTNISSNENKEVLLQKSDKIYAVLSDTSETEKPKDTAHATLNTGTDSIPSNKIIESNVIKFRKFSTGFLGSPDFSSVGFFKFGEPGTDIGIFGEYHLTNRWTIFTALIRTSKKYSSKGGYNASNGYWANKDKVDKIEGSCMVLDIPLNIKYYFLQGPKNLMFVSTGLSSYFMYYEKYSFYTSSDSERSWSSNDRRNYYLSVINFSFGYERYLSKGFSVQVEPFIKVPMKNIGSGKTTLLTGGMFLYLKYNIGY
jgi:hypothetical protein